MRRADRQITDMEGILAIAESAKFLHLAMFDGNFPYIVPLHFGYEYADGALTFYMHGAKEGHKLDLIKACPNACVELECDVVPISGGEVPCNYGSAFASIIARGQVCLVEDEQEKMHALNALMKHQTGREFPFAPQMVASVAVIKFVSTDFTAKRKVMPQAKPAMMPKEG